ncbi:MAG: hypothetical protein MZV64_11765 [Ignavibacteriales bacterium]|nr:hypothetical protein [Ignavibacteriales bacterium]
MGGRHQGRSVGETWPRLPGVRVVDAARALRPAGPHRLAHAHRHPGRHERGLRGHHARSRRRGTVINADDASILTALSGGVNAMVHIDARQRQPDRRAEPGRPEDEVGPPVGGWLVVKEALP